VKAAGKILAAFGLAVLIGGMVFFAAVMAPLIFTRLPAAMGDPFIRSAFPFYYLFCAVSAGLAAVGFVLLRQRICVVVILVIISALLWAWFWLIPELDAMRAAGNMAGFDRGHSESVWLNGAELLAACWLLARLVV
jgi:hypothetical protein